MGLFDGIDVDKKLKDTKERADKHFTDEEKQRLEIDSVIKEKICSSKEDEENLLALLNGLNMATSLKDKENHIADNITRFGSILVKIIDTFIV